MKYWYKCYGASGESRKDRIDDYISLSSPDVNFGNFIHVYDENDAYVTTIQGEDALESWQISMERANQWKPEIREPDMTVVKDAIVKDAIKPSHYQGFIEDIQWIDATVMNARYRDEPRVIEGAVELQVRKYLDRNGKKDAAGQEYFKAFWYLAWLCAFMVLGVRRDLGKIAHRTQTYLKDQIEAAK
jgi:hypothetical protein